MNHQALIDAKNAATLLVLMVCGFHKLTTMPGALDKPMRRLIAQRMRIINQQFNEAQRKIIAVNPLLVEARGIDHPAVIGSIVRESYHKVAVQLVLELDRETEWVLFETSDSPFEQWQQFQARGLDPEVVARNADVVGARLRDWDCPDCAAVLALIELESAAAGKLLAEHSENEDWMSAKEANDRAQEFGLPCTPSWLAKSAAAQGVKMRPRRLPGRHKSEVEWYSLLNVLADKKLGKSRSEEPPSEADLQARIDKARTQRRLERPVD